MGWYKVLAVFAFIQSLVTIGSLLTSQPLLFPLNDFESFAKQTGNELLESSQKDNKFYFLLKKA